MVTRLIIALLLVASTGLHALAMENHADVLRDQYGNIIGGATVTVYLTGTTSLATIYSDNGLNFKANPFLTDALTGRYNFYAENGAYDLVFTYPGITFDPLHTQRVTLYDPADGGGGGGGGGGGVTGWPTVSTTKEVTWADSFSNALLIGNSTNKWAFYNDATDGLQFVGVCGGVLNDCNYIRKLAAGRYTEWLNSAGVSIGRLTESTGAWTNFTLNTESTGNTLTMQEEQWWDVVGCQGSTASHIWNTPAANAPAAACDTGTNTQKGYASFDATTDESFQMDWVLPAGFTGSIDVHFIWKAAATTGSVAWCAQLVRVADSSTSDPAFPAQATGNCVSDAAKGTTLQENHATITGVTCTACVARDHVYVSISRDPDSTSTRTDDMSGDAHLMKVGRTWRMEK